jgi:7-keto-8-aminopelargonate synthetase-like enzyme
MDWRRRYAEHRGNSHAVVEPEAEIADLHRKSSAPVFSSGYVPNEADLGTVLPDCVISLVGKITHR